jgi:hypothetical protein
VRSVVIFSVLLAACASASLTTHVPDLPQDQRCETAAEDRRWLSDALIAWQTALRDFLKSADQHLPMIVVYDVRCSYTLAAFPTSNVQWSPAEHRGEIILPNGGNIPPAPNAFNAVTDAGDNFVVMSLPSIWRPVAPKSEIPLNWFLEGVLIHELGHWYQSAVTPDISFPALLKRLPPSANISDDSVQEAFEANAGYVRAYEAERDLLYRAASAPNEHEARAYTCDALDRLRTRRTRYFTGSNEHWAAVDEISLTTEGLGQWLSYKRLTEKHRLAPSLVQSKLRGRYWSQDEGLGIFLTIDRLVPDWQKRLFTRSPTTADDLLELACDRR